MTVKFYILQRDDETGNTRNKYLFKAEHTEMYNDNQITHQETTYLVKLLEWSNTILKAKCVEVPKRLNNEPI